MKTFFKIVILVAALVFALKSCGPFSGTPSALIGQQAPDFTLETLKGQKVNMTQYRDGQSAMIFFWATWCPHCRRELSNLTQQRDQIEQKGIKVVLINVGESSQKVKAYFDASQISFDVFLDQSTEIAENYRIVGVPTFFFINNEGVVVAAEHSLPSLKNYY